MILEQKKIITNYTFWEIKSCLCLIMKKKQLTLASLHAMVNNSVDDGCNVDISLYILGKHRRAPNIDIASVLGI